MRQNPNHKRTRGRGNGRKPSSGRAQTFDSHGPSVRIRGNAHQVFEKYLALARDATAAGDRIGAENFFQHAEHYLRIMNANAQSNGQERSSSQGRREHGDERNGAPRNLDTFDGNERHGEATSGHRAAGPNGGPVDDMATAEREHRGSALNGQPATASNEPADDDFAPTPPQSSKRSGGRRRNGSTRRSAETAEIAETAESVGAADTGESETRQEPDDTQSQPAAKPRRRASAKRAEAGNCTPETPSDDGDGFEQQTT